MCVQSRNESQDLGRDRSSKPGRAAEPVPCAVGFELRRSYLSQAVHRLNDNVAHLFFMEAENAHVVLRMQRHQTRRLRPSHLRREEDAYPEPAPRRVWRDG